MLVILPGSVEDPGTTTTPGREKGASRLLYSDGRCRPFDASRGKRHSETSFAGR
jgi:hypothetical protein